MAEQLAVRYGIRQRYSDVEAMLDGEHPDVVHVTTPPQSHLPLALKALDAGCHVLVEKPLTLCYADSKTLVAHAVNRHRKLTIAYGFYFDPIARAMRDLLSEGVLGELVHVESFLGYDLAGHFGSCVLANREHWVHELSGKLVHNVIDHVVNKVAEFVSDQATVHARLWQRHNGQGGTLEVPDELRLMVFDPKISAFATFTCHARPIAHFLDVFGTKNTARLDFEIGTLTLASSSALPGALGRLSRTFGQGMQYIRHGTKNTVHLVRSEYRVLAGLHFLISAFYECIRRDTSVPIPYQDLLRVSALTDAAFSQCREQQFVA
jgi:predicted dehydrogenase